MEGINLANTSQVPRVQPIPRTVEPQSNEMGNNPSAAVEQRVVLETQRPDIPVFDHKEEKDKEQDAQQPNEQKVIDSIERANKAFKMHNSYLKFSIHEKTKQIMVKIVNTETNEVIREVPPEKLLDMVAKMCEIAGILVDERR